jgi:glucose-6-phosphate 1-epimerase
MADGTYKKAGEFLEEYLLENENGAKAICRTYGGNVFTYVTKDGIEVMGTRKDASGGGNGGDDSKPYAGGAPHCFPQFGPGELMQHGFARGMKFVPEERAKKMSFDRMIFKLVPTEETLKVWDHHFEYRFDITLRADCLEWDLIIKNEGDKPFDITLGMHNYFDISSLKNVRIEGPFTGKTTVDRNNGGAEGKGDSDSIEITTPTDMMFVDCQGPISIIDTGKGTKTTIEAKGFPDRCIWSPHGNEAMGFDKFICVEPVASAKAVTIPVGKFKETSFYQKVSCVKI